MFYTILYKGSISNHGWSTVIKILEYCNKKSHPTLAPRASHGSCMVLLSVLPFNLHRSEVPTEMAVPHPSPANVDETTRAQRKWPWRRRCLRCHIVNWLMDKNPGQQLAWFKYGSIAWFYVAVESFYDMTESQLGLLLGGRMLSALFCGMSQLSIDSIVVLGGLSRP